MPLSQGFWRAPGGTGPEAIPAGPTQDDGKPAAGQSDHLANPGGVGYSIESDAIPSLIKKLNQALDCVRKARQLTVNSTMVQPPAADPAASPRAAKAMGTDLAQNHMQANKAAEGALVSMINSLKSIQGNYQNTEETNAKSYRGQLGQG